MCWKKGRKELGAKLEPKQDNIREKHAKKKRSGGKIDREKNNGGILKNIEINSLAGGGSKMEDCRRQKKNWQTVFNKKWEEKKSLVPWLLQTKWEVFGIFEYHGSEKIPLKSDREKCGNRVARRSYKFQEKKFPNPTAAIPASLVYTTVPQ